MPPADPVTATEPRAAQPGLDEADPVETEEAANEWIVDGRRTFIVRHPDDANNHTIDGPWTIIRDIAKAPPATRHFVPTSTEWETMSEDARARSRTLRKLSITRTEPVEHTAWTEAVESALDVMSDSIQDSEAKPGIIIDAYRGAGKSKFLRFIAVMIYRMLAAQAAAEGKEPYQPWVTCASITRNTTAKSAAGLVLECLGVKASSIPQMRETDIITAAGRNLDTERRGTRLLIIDEANHFGRGGSDLDEFAKALLNKANINLFLAGYDMAEPGRLLDGSASSVGERLVPHPWTRNKYCDTADRDEWDFIVTKLENQLPLVSLEPGALTCHSELLNIRADGSVGTLVFLLKAAAGRAIRNGTETIDEPLLNQIRLPANPARAEAERVKAAKKEADAEAKRSKAAAKKVQTTAAARQPSVEPEPAALPPTDTAP